MYDTIIIGAGPAGFSAAIYAGRAGLKTLLLGIPSESSIFKASVIDNYFGVDGNISGAELLNRGRKQAIKAGVEFEESEVVDLVKNKDDFAITAVNKNKYETKTIIICSGLNFKPSGIKNEQQFVGRGVSYCVTCDGPFFKQKKVAVIGNTNFAACEAMHLAIYTPNVSILSHGKEISISQDMQRDLSQKNITVIETGRVSEFLGNGKLEAVSVDGKNLKFDGIFMAMGAAGASDFANKLGLERHGPQNSYLVINPRTGATNIPGVYAAGDCVGGHAQAAKSVGEGCNAAIGVIEYIKGMSKYVDYC